MPAEDLDSESPWQELYGPNLGYIQEMYERYRSDPNAVEEELRAFFNRWGAPPVSDKDGHRLDDVLVRGEGYLEKAVAAGILANRIRTYGHLAAHIHPLEEKTDGHLIRSEEYGLSEQDLEEIPAKIVWKYAPDNIYNGKEAIKRLRQIYTKSLAYEFNHVYDLEEQKWLNRMVESGSVNHSMSDDERVKLLKRLTEVNSFEQFLHQTFVGQKRFSIEGVDSLIPMLDKMIHDVVHDGARSVMIGMAHRGRLNVLAHILGKPYEVIFSEFHNSLNKELFPSEGSMGINFGWTGDVKYHLGADRNIEEESMLHAHLTLANNPSHLEFVNPVVEGYARAAQEDRMSPGIPVQNISKALPILIHGDAAFPGEGIVSETLNLSRLPGYQTGGTIHIIANNLLGFTTASRDDRSTRYASDLAKGFEIPIVHVNADDPEACLDAIEFAYQYRRQFKKDFLIDLVGYRRYGHNEMDDPIATQPLLYDKINKHPGVHKLYAEQLKAKGIITEDQVKKMAGNLTQKLKDIHEKMVTNDDGEVKELVPPETVAEKLPFVETAVSLDTLRDINKSLLDWPEGFHVYPKLKKILERRRNALDDGKKVDWASAEVLAFSSILADGTPIRLTGQDTERGTFAQRHLVLHDHKMGKAYSPLHVIPQAKASFSVYNSPLSEASVLGFEYGYDVMAPKTLVLWEAQYGDFANTGQVIFDQFLAAGRAKWGQKSGLVILLPHGYEGQGPEHSSARLERYLQLAAENNWTVANLTSAAQYFHVLRRQAALIGRDEIRPLVIMTPKSLIRNPRVASPGKAFSHGEFHLVLEHQGTGEDTQRTDKLVFCSGKMGVEISERLESEKELSEGVHVVFIEQLYPFPREELRKIIHRYPHLQEVVWVQEEPKNMGAWTYMEPRLEFVSPDPIGIRYVGRLRRSSPAEGQPDVHKVEQDRIITEALQPVKANTFSS